MTVTAPIDPSSGVRHVRAAVIGTGFVGPFHVDAIRRGGYADVVAIAGSDRSRAEARAVSLGVERGALAADVLGDDGIDVVHICTPNRTHVELATAALESGKHVVVEKPVGLTVREARPLVDLADRVGRHVAVAYTYRGYPMVRRARDLVAAGELGDVRLVHGGYIQDWLADPASYNWRLEPETSGASRAIADIGSHWFDTAEFVSGLRVDSVLADMATFIPVRSRARDGNVAFATGNGEREDVAVRSEDAATILLRFAGGARGACVVSQISPGLKNAFTLQFAGARRTLDWNQEDSEHLWLRDRDESRLLTRGPADVTDDAAGVPSLPAGHPEGWAEALRDLLRPFYRAVVSDAPPAAARDAKAYPSLSDGIRGLAFVEACIRSAASGTWAAIDSVT